MAAVLACGDGAVLSHTSAAALWGLTRQGRSVEVTVPGFRCPAHPGIAIHRRSLRPEDATERDRIPVTSVVRTPLDLACRLSAPRLERAVNEGGQARPDRSRIAARRVGWAAQRAGAPVVASPPRPSHLRAHRVRARASLPATRPAARPSKAGHRRAYPGPPGGLPLAGAGPSRRDRRPPLPPDPSAAGEDRRRDQVLAAAGLTPLRFTYEQVVSAPAEVERTLRAVTARLRAGALS